MILNAKTPSTASQEAQEFLNQLKEKFTARYSVTFQDLNKFVMDAPSVNDTMFSVPNIELSDGGTTHAEIGAELPKVSPAEISVKTKEVQGFNVQYKIHIPLDQCQVALKNESTFNFLFDNIIGLAITNYEKNYGPHKVTRFGKSFCDAELLWFNDDFVELKLSGNFAA
jgi:HSP20 family molecular chaperone IbpA